MEKKITPKQAVTEQIVNMLTNNIINENGNETFDGWCEDGEVFRTSYPNETEEFYIECDTLMDKVSDLVDKLTYRHLAEF